MKNILVQSDAVSFLSRIPESMAKLVYLDPPSDFEYILGPSSESTQAYLKYLLRILFHSREILRPDGFLAINIPHHYRVEIQAILEQFFGKRNFATEIIVPNRRAHQLFRLGSWHTSILIFGRSDASQLFEVYRPLDRAERAYYHQRDESGPFRLESLIAVGDRRTLSYSFDGYTPPVGRHWKFSEEKLISMKDEGRIFFGRGMPQLKRYLSESNQRRLSNVWDDIDQFQLGHERTGLQSQQSIVLLTRLLNMLACKDDIVVDPFCGSGTSLISSIDNGIAWMGSDASAAAISVVQERVQNLGLSAELRIQSSEEFDRDNKQCRQMRNVDAGLQIYLERSVSPIKLNRNNFKRRVAFIVGVEKLSGEESAFIT